MQWLNVVYMNEASPMFAIDLLKVEATACACSAVILDASMSSLGISLVVVYAEYAA